jgi:hypothetical protein
VAPAVKRGAEEHEQPDARGQEGPSAEVHAASLLTLRRRRQSSHRESDLRGPRCASRWQSSHIVTSVCTAVIPLSAHRPQARERHPSRALILAARLGLVGMP